MWFLQLSKLYLFLFGIPIIPGKVRFPRKLLIIYRCGCYISIAISTFFGLYIIIIKENSFASPWSILHSWNFVMTIAGKCFGAALLTFMSKDISSAYSMASFMHKHFNSKLSIGRRDARLNFLMSIVSVSNVVCNFTDIFVNSVPVSTILKYLRKRCSGGTFLLGIVTFTSLPITWIFYGLGYNFMVMIIDDLYFEGAIFKQFCTDQVDCRTNMFTNEESIMFVITRHSLADLEDRDSSPSVKKTKISRLKMLSRTYHRISIIHQIINRIYGDISIWILLCNSLEYPLYITYCLNGVNLTNVSSNGLIVFFVVLTVQSFMHLLLILIISYKRYIMKIKVIGCIYSVANNKLKTVLVQFANQVSCKYLESGPMFFEMDSTVFDLMSTFTFLLLTTYLVSDHQ